MAEFPKSISRVGASPVIPATPPAHGPAFFHAALRSLPEDFRVDERLTIEHTGEGEHLWLRIEKRLLNTSDVLALLERVYAVGSADVGVSGLKDRRAVTRQWFSVRTPLDAAPFKSAATELSSATEASSPTEPTEPSGPSGPSGPSMPSGPSGPFEERSSLRLLDSARHSRKLRRGAHVANVFEITLRDVEPLPAGSETAESAEAFLSAAAERVERLRADGFPNYLGPQRFGHGGSNLVRARAWFRTPKKRASRQQRGLWLSAARSALFNRICAARVADGSWSRAIDGEPLMLDGSRSFFVPDGASRDDGSVADRIASGDVHPSGPWWGRGASPASRACAVLEASVLEDAADLRGGLERAGLEQERRALRALAPDLVLTPVDARTLRLTCSLPPGVFATTLLAEFGTYTTGERR